MTRSACWEKRLPRLLALALIALLPCAALCADDLAFDVERNCNSFSVSARATLLAAPAMVWEVLTDYEHLARFIPGLSQSRVEERVGNRLLLEQKGEAHFLVFSYPIEVRLQVEETPPGWIVSRGIAGNMKRMNGRYDVQAARGGVRLRYTGELEPGFELPPIIGTLAVRTMVEEQFGAMVAEIERRAALSK